LDRYTGVVIFATNLAANFDPAFERRIRTHVLFELPGEAERVKIWKVQLHPSRTPLGADVDFDALAQQYQVSGGDIQNAVLKAALTAAAEPIPDLEKRIHQRHFETGIDQVMASKRVMQQSIFAEPPSVVAPEREVVVPGQEAEPSEVDDDVGECAHRFRFKPTRTASAGGISPLSPWVEKFRPIQLVASND